MDHNRGQIRSCKEALQMKREKKVVALCKDSGINLSTEMLQVQDLRTTDHHSHDLFDSSDLRQVEQQHERRRTKPTMTRTQEDEEIHVTKDGRLKGRFVSGSVVNLSRRELSEEDVSLLSKGLKFSPTPTDIDKAKRKEDLEAYKRRMRLRWHFRNNMDSDSQDATDNNSNNSNTFSNTYSGYMNSGKTQSCGRFGQGLHQYDFSKSEGACMWISDFRGGAARWPGRVLLVAVRG